MDLLEATRQLEKKCKEQSDEIERLQADNAALRQKAAELGTWRPLESAPIDGTPVIGLLRSGLAFKVKKTGYYTDCDTSLPLTFRWTYEDNDSFTPCEGNIIGWMPLPTTPQEMKE